MKHHNITIFKEEFEAKAAGLKPWERCMNYEGYKVGDTVTFHEVDDMYKPMTGRKIGPVKITYIQYQTSTTNLIFTHTNQEERPVNEPTIEEIMTPPGEDFRAKILDRPLATKPPLGLVPREIAMENRLQEIGCALFRYREAGIKEVPIEWAIEAVELGRQLAQLRAGK